MFNKRFPAKIYVLEKFKDAYFSIKHITVDQVNNFIVVNILDPWHLTKNVCTVIKKFPSSKSKRSIYYKNSPVNTGMSNICWLLRGGGSSQLQEIKLSKNHFNKDNNSQMNVVLNTQSLAIIFIIDTKNQIINA